MKLDKEGLVGYIYLIRNKINHKVYIGKRVTKSKNYSKEVYFGSGKLIKLAIEKYGISNFSKQYLEFIFTNKRELSSREIYWIDKFKNKFNLYNITKGGDGWKCKHREDSKKKMSLTKKENRKVFFEDVYRLYIEEGHTLKSVSKEIGISKATVSKVLKDFNIKLRNSAIYKKKPLGYKSPSKIYKRKGRTPMSIERREILRKKRIGNPIRIFKNIKQYSLEGTLIKEWRDTKEIVNFYNLKNASSVLRVLRGERKKFKNSIWKK